MEGQKNSEKGQQETDEENKKFSFFDFVSLEEENEKLTQYGIAFFTALLAILVYAWFT